MSDADIWKESTVIPSVRAVAVYTNPNGDIVIRQEGYPDEDDFIVIPRGAVNSLVEALKAEAEAAAK